MDMQREFENFEAGCEGHETALHIFEAGAKAMLEHVRGQQEPVKAVLSKNVLMIARLFKSGNMTPDSLKGWASAVEVYESDFYTTPPAHPVQPAGCAISQISSRMCERGTHGCVVEHEPPAAAINEQLLEALKGVIRLSNEAYQHWDNDNDSKVGKILAAIAGWSTNYHEDANKLHDAIAAAEAHRKGGV